MKRKLVMLILTGGLVLFAWGRNKNQSSSISKSRGPALGPNYDQHRSLHNGLPGLKLEFENDFVQVVRITIKPHEKLPMHSLTPRVVVLLTDESLRLTFPSGETRKEQHKAGEAMWVSAQKHAGENLSDKPIEFIAVIPRQK